MILVDTNILKWKVRSRDFAQQLCARMEAAEGIRLNRDAVFRK